MKNYTIVHLTKFRDDTIINNGEKKKDKENSQRKNERESLKKSEREQVKNVVFINFIFYNPYLTAFIAVVNCGV